MPNLATLPPQIPPTATILRTISKQPLQQQSSRRWIKSICTSSYHVAWPPTNKLPPWQTQQDSTHRVKEAQSPTWSSSASSASPPSWCRATWRGPCSSFSSKRSSAPNLKLCRVLSARTATTRQRRAWARARRKDLQTAAPLTTPD